MGKRFSIVMLALLAAPARAQEPAAGVPVADEAAAYQALAKAQARVAEREEALGRTFDPAYRHQLVERLAAAGREEPTGGGPAPAFPGARTEDLLYTPVAPCRIIDTRLAGGALAPGAPRNFLVAGDILFDTQGGHAGGCGIPFGPAVAVMINFVAVSPSGPGNLRAWAYGGAVPDASIINYAAIGTNLANGLVVPLCTASCARDLTVRADGSGAELVADVLGFYQAYPKSLQGSTAGTTVVNSLDDTFAPALLGVPMAAGESIHVTAGLGIFAHNTSMGALCTTCLQIRGEFGACYRPAGGGTPVVGHRQFMWDSAGHFAGGEVAARRSGLLVQHLFTIPAAGNYDFGICGRRSGTIPADADWNIARPNVLISRP